MDNFNIYNDPIISRKRKGSKGDPFKQVSETLQVNKNYTLLSEVPNRKQRVEAYRNNQPLIEVESHELDSDTFRVDYTNGIVYFHESLSGEYLTLKYLGEGVLLFPDSRIFLTDSNEITAKEKFRDIDREILNQKVRIEEQLKSVPQPSEIVDGRIDRNGKVFPVLKERIDNEQKKIEDAQKDYSGKIHSSLKARLDEGQKEIIDARRTTDGTQLFNNLDDRLKYDNNAVLNEMKSALNVEVTKLNKKIERVVNVLDFGAVGDGITDCSEAFKLAMSNGKVKVNIPAGTYIVKGLKVPSYTILSGDGIGITTIKLHNSTPGYEWVITNKDYTNGNSHIQIRDLTADWNLARPDTNTTGNQHGSCVTFANVKYGWIQNVEAINAGLHGFDVSSPVYKYDETYAEGASKYVWVDNCIASNFGDDGFTTHHSEFIFISNCMAYNARGSNTEEGAGNSNGFEVDDGSKHVWLYNNYSTNNIRGFEVKAHQTAPAAQNVHIIGCSSYRDVRSFDFRHIGHHLESDPDSTTAFNINVVDCTAMEPRFNILYSGLTPRALVISAYKNVAISNFTAIGDPSYDYQNNPVIALQYKCRNIGFHNFNIKGFKKASTDIRLIGGDQKTDNVNISNVQIYHSAPEGIGIGGSITNVNLNNISMINDGTGVIGFSTVNSQDSIIGAYAEGYTNASKIAGTTYKSMIPNNIKNGTRIGASSGQTLKDTSVLIASTVDSVAGSDKTVVMASSNSSALGENSMVLASSGGSKTVGYRDVVIGSNNSRTELADKSSKIVMASNNVINDNSYTVRGGYGDGDVPNKRNTKWELDSLNGNIKSTGSITGSSNFSDYAEYFESFDGSKIQSGYIVTLEGEKIRIANDGDEMLGVVSETAGVLLGENSFVWQGRYLKNDFGGLIYEERVVKERDDDTGEEIEVIRLLPKENPNYTPDSEYVSRKSRDEWHTIGLIGQVYIRCDNTVTVGDTIKPKNGIATKADDRGQGWKVMKVTKPYSQTVGYGVALCFIR
ncbi:peptidase G2 autoproteolytic cleavage domain-containing protein [Rossellomorea marisflavi]|uniref:peptidase G2 autoproteolytic cleavage domain-containing protein n=1 Tax=Rossellomorea marisflavi TaxID=189381 RepID=UPI00345D6D94